MELATAPGTAFWVRVLGTDGALITDLDEGSKILQSFWIFVVMYSSTNVSTYSWYVPVRMINRIYSYNMGRSEHRAKHTGHCLVLVEKHG